MITPVQCERRRKHLGASDTGALFGVDPYKTDYDVALSKIYPLKEDVPSLAAQVGNAVETTIVHWLSQRYKFKYTVEPEKLLVPHPTNKIF